MPINVHASLLPRHRGAAPIEGAILAGDRESGVTIMRVIERMDAGPILLQRAIALAADETQATLKEKLAELGARALLEAIAQFRDGDCHRDAAGRESRDAHHADRKGRFDNQLERPTPIQIERMIRATIPGRWPARRYSRRGPDDLAGRGCHGGFTATIRGRSSMTTVSRTSRSNQTKADRAVRPRTACADRSAGAGPPPDGGGRLSARPSRRGGHVPRHMTPRRDQSSRVRYVRRSRRRRTADPPHRARNPHPRRPRTRLRRCPARPSPRPVSPRPIAA